MPCTNPLIRFRMAGKRDYEFMSVERSNGRIPAKATESQIISCGSCLSCRRRTTHDWAVRQLHELQTRDNKGMFMLLTYNNDNIPRDGGLVKSHLQDFNKRLRRRLGRKGQNYSFYACGEYGDRTNRPHYHMNLFGWEPDDKTWYLKTKSGNNLYTSKMLDDCWKHGYVNFGSITMDSALYVAKYVQKKITGENATTHYRRFDSETGESFDVQPEFQLQSQSIGIDWLKQFYTDVFKKDSLGTVVIKGEEKPVPKAYFKKLETIDPELHEAVKAKRDEWAQANGFNEVKANIPAALKQAKALALEMQTKAQEAYL